MAIRTGKELLQSLRDDSLMFIDGERVADVTTDPRFARAARSLAALYDMQHDPALVERMTFRSPTSGERAGLSFIEPRSVDDLIRRREMGKIWADATCGMFGRSPDYMNIFVTGMASAADQFGHKDQGFAANIRACHRHIRENNVCMTHTLINPQVDRSKPVEQQDKDLAAKIVKESDAGIVIRGARMVSTPAAMPLWTVCMMYPKMFVRMCEIIQLLGAGGLVAVPSYAELDGPAAADVTTYFQAANADAGSRIKLFRLAFDAALSSFAGRQQLYERYYSGDPVRLAGTLWGLYDKDTRPHHPPAPRSGISGGSLMLIN